MINSGEFQGRRLMSVCPDDIPTNTIKKGTKFTIEDGSSASDRLESKTGANILK